MQLPVLSPPRHRGHSTLSRERNTAGAPDATTGAFRNAIIDNYGRPIQYLRLALTDKCNLRCTYCMPENMRFVKSHQLLSDEEILRIVRICAELGITKLRLTGGEPFLRPHLCDLIEEINQIRGIEEVHITTNGVEIKEYIPDIVRIGIASVNLSMDSFDADRFYALTRRNEFESVRASFYALLGSGVHLNVNAVVMEGINIDDIIPMAELTRTFDFDMRFIEEMPFNGAFAESGNNHWSQRLHWNHVAIIRHLQKAFPYLESIDRTSEASTAEMFRVPGYKGRIGVIAGFSRTFCGSCNRIRITAQGVLKTCLYDNGVLDVRQLLRSGASDDEVRLRLIECFQHRYQDGIEAERASHTHGEAFDSMSRIGG